MQDNSIRNLTWALIIVALIGAAAVVIAALITRPTQPFPTAPPDTVQPTQSPIVGLDDIVGTWTGSASAPIINSSQYTDFQVTVIIDEQCKIGDFCGTLDLSTLDCIIDLRLVSVNNKEFIFSKEGCGNSNATDSILPISKSRIRWTPQGGTTSAVLVRTSK